MNIFDLQRKFEEADRAIQLKQRELVLKVERLRTESAAIEFEVQQIEVPGALTDLDTTVTGAQLNAKHLSGEVGTSTELGLTASATYVQSEVQSIADRLDQLIGYFGDLVGVLNAAQITGVLVLPTYLRSDGTSAIFRPDGSSSYLRP